MSQESVIKKSHTKVNYFLSENEKLELSYWKTNRIPALAGPSNEEVKIDRILDV